MVKSAGISVHTGLINSQHKIYWNQRHASLDSLPKRYNRLPRYGVIRNPEEWYISFYKFFVNVQGYMSFMLNDLGEDGFIHPINFEEFIKRSANLKDTLIKYPNKARVFNNILRSQGNIHFVTGYFKEPIDIKNNIFGDLETLDQFDMSLYEWFYRGCGMHTSTNIPMNKLEEVESLFDIKIGHQNKTRITENNKDIIYNPKSLELVQLIDSKFYNEINNYKGVK